MLNKLWKTWLVIIWLIYTIALIASAYAFLVSCAYMAEATNDVLDFLEQLRKERDDLNVLIAGIEKRLGISPATAHSHFLVGMSSA